MRILFIGDTHGEHDLSKIRPEIVEQLNLSQSDVIIHLGDIGICWQGQIDEVFHYWNNLPCKVIVCLGNHENYDWIEKQPLMTKYNAVGYQISNNIFAPRIGSILTIFDKTFWFYPGAYSFDYPYRKLGVSLFKQELPLKKDSDKALEILEKQGFVDMIISHDGPRSFVTEFFGYPIGDASDNYLEKTQQERGERVHPGIVLDELRNRTELYHKWYFGHHHQDYGPDNIRCLFEKMMLWDLATDTHTIIEASE